MKIRDLHHKKIAILWFGKEGQSTLRFLREQGIENITVLDKNVICSSDSNIEYISGEEYLDNLDIYDIILKSPGVSPFQEQLLPYRDKFVSQSQIFFANYPGKVIWITGTKGKSTISTLITSCLQESGYDVKLVGNIGSPVLDEIDFSWEIHDYVIYELSSYMLQDFSPNLHIGYLNNIFPCHLDWHFDSFSIYREAKVNILRNAQTRIIHGDFANDSEVLWLREEKVFFDSKGRYQIDEKGFFIDGEYIYNGPVKLLWNHNRKNILWVIAILDHIIQDNNKLHEILLSVLPSFVWLPHRIENIGKYEGITFINDAIATTPESTIAAINTFPGDLQTLFLWWEDSGFNFDTIRQVILESSISNIIAFPDTSEKIFPELEVRDYEQAFEIEIEGKSIQFIKTRSMKAGVDFAYKTTLPGKIAMLSCAAPSFSLWDSYTMKAQEFRKEVSEY